MHQLIRALRVSALVHACPDPRDSAIALIHVISHGKQATHSRIAHNVATRVQWLASWKISRAS